MNYWRRLARRLLLIITVLMVLAGAGAFHTGRIMKRLDREHTRFLDCGQSINLFLKRYGQEMADAHRGGDLSPVMAFYIEEYRSMGRGRWKLGREEDLGAASLSRLEVHGHDDYGSTSLATELSEYLARIGSVKSVKCKINLIENVVPGESAVVTVKYILDGTDRLGRQIEDRFFFRWRLRKVELPSDLKDWRIVSDELVSGERVAGRADGFFSPTPL